MTTLWLKEFGSCDTPDSNVRQLECLRKLQLQLTITPSLSKHSSFRNWQRERTSKKKKQKFYIKN